MYPGLVRRAYSSTAVPVRYRGTVHEVLVRVYSSTTDVIHAWNRRRSAGARDAALSHDAQPRLVGWRLEGVPVLGPEGSWGRETAPGCCRWQGLWGGARAGRSAAAERAQGVGKHPLLIPYNFRIHFPVFVRVRACRCPQHTPTPGGAPTPQRDCIAPIGTNQGRRHRPGRREGRGRSSSSPR